MRRCWIVLGAALLVSPLQSTALATNPQRELGVKAKISSKLLRLATLVAQESR